MATRKRRLKKTAPKAADKRTASGRPREAAPPPKDKPAAPRAGNESTRTANLQAAGNKSPDKRNRSNGLRDGGRPSLVVGIGASAGGLEAVEEFLARMPPDTGMCFVVVMHHHPGHVSLLPDILSKRTKLRVAEAREGTRVEADTLYVCGPGSQLTLRKSILRVEERDPGETPHLPIDRFLRSLAEDQQERAVGIILSGTGTDGTLGVRAIKAESGMAMAQDPDTAKYAGMPRSAIDTGLVDYFLAPGEMPQRLALYADNHRTGQSPGGKWKDEEKAPEGIRKVFSLLRSQTGHDFSSYKSSTVYRRIARRMAVHQIDDLGHYAGYLQENPSEIDLLFRELLISVTHFFRDRPAFDSLLKQGLPRLFAGREGDDNVRVWVPGCATGEEVYSIAILLREYMEKENARRNVHIFGTDLDTSAIDFARAGLYPAGIEADISPERLKRFFAREDGHYRIAKEIRDMAIFSPQNVTKDPPFAKLDILSCRNVLIYMGADLQKRLLDLFHYALKPNGLLFLGPSETVGGSQELFQSLNTRWKIFMRKPGPPVARPGADAPVIRPEAAPPEIRPRPMPDIASIVEEVLLERYAPACVIVNEAGEIAYSHGRIDEFLGPIEGVPRKNILWVAREGLRHEVVVALREATSGKEEIVRPGLRVQMNGDEIFVDLSVRRLAGPEMLRGMLMVCFRKVPRPGHSAGVRKGGGRMARRSQKGDLKDELRGTKEVLQHTIEELQSSNEEIMSTNEELQSSNEELETSREELQSLNEELQTVNAELEAKVAELLRSHGETQNLLDSMGIAALFLSDDLRILRFTRGVDKFVRLIPSDVGRPIGDLTYKLKETDLVRDIDEVRQTLKMKTADAQTTGGAPCRIQVMPYRTMENAVEGVIVTFMDIEKLQGPGS